MSRGLLTVLLVLIAADPASAAKPRLELVGGPAYVDGEGRAGIAFRCRGSDCHVRVRLGAQRRRVSVAKGKVSGVTLRVGSRRGVTLRLRFADGQRARLRVTLTRKGRRTCGYGRWAEILETAGDATLQFWPYPDGSGDGTLYVCRGGTATDLYEINNEAAFDTERVVGTFLSQRWAAVATYLPDSRYGQSELQYCGLRLADARVFEESAPEYGSGSFAFGQIAVTDAGALVVGYRHGSIGRVEVHDRTGLGTVDEGPGVDIDSVSHDGDVATWSRDGQPQRAATRRGNWRRAEFGYCNA